MAAMRVSRLVVVPAATAVVLGLGLSALFLGTSGQTGPAPNPTVAAQLYVRSAIAPPTGTTFDCGKGSEIVAPSGDVEGSTSVTMPNLVGRSLTKAETELYCSGIRYTVLSVPTQSAPANSILDQSPAAGTMVTLSATVHLTVAFG
jgi:hypothetical protein